MGHHEFHIHDNFFDLGGDSIGAAIMISDIEKHFQLELSIEVFWQDATIRGLTDTIRLKSQSPDFNTKESEDLGIPELTDKKYALLHRIVEELKVPEGRTKLLNQRKFKPRLTFLWKKFSQAYQKGRGLGFIIDWFQMKATKLLFGTMSYPRSVKLLSWLITRGAASLFLSPKRRKQIQHFNHRITPGYSRAQLHKSYLFYILQEYQIINWARIIYKEGKLPEMNVTIEGEHILHESIENGKGVLLIGSHTSANLWVNTMDLDILTLGDVEGILMAYGLEKYEPSIFASMLGTAITHLKNGGIVKLVADGDHGNGIRYPYHIAGFRKELFTGFAEIALMTGATTIPLTSHMPNPFHVTIRFDQPFSYPEKTLEHAEQVKFMIDQYADILQQQVVNYPWQVSIKHIIPEGSINDQSESNPGDSG